MIRPVSCLLSVVPYRDRDESARLSGTRTVLSGVYPEEKKHLSGHYPDASSGALSAEALRTSLSGSSGRVICEGMAADSVKVINNYPDSIRTLSGN